MKALFEGANIIRKFSLAYLTIPGTHPVEQIRIAAEAGYEYVGLRPIPLNLSNESLFQFDKDRNLFKKQKQHLKKIRLSC